MPPVGVALMLEALSPARALDHARAAAGLRGVMGADVFQPWIAPVNDGDRAPYMWNVLAAAGALTGGSLGGVITPNFRHHPAVIAQASATLEAMYPGRHWLGLSAGEAVNDAITGAPWPRAPERIAAMFEAADLIGKLFTNSAAGRDTRFSGTHAQVHGARLWTVPEVAPKVLIATAGPLTARRAGREADGIITMGTSVEKARTLLERFTQGRTEVGKTREGTLTVVRLHVAWAPTVEEALTGALRFWPQAGMRFNIADIRSPFDLGKIAQLVRPEDFEGNLLVTTRAGEIREAIRAYLDLGFDEVYVHNACATDAAWVEELASTVVAGL